MPSRSRSPDYARKWFWYQDPATGWWSWHYHNYDWTPPENRHAKENALAASSTSPGTPLETAGTGPEHDRALSQGLPMESAGKGPESGQAMMKESKEKEAVVDMDIDG